MVSYGLIRPPFHHIYDLTGGGYALDGDSNHLSFYHNLQKDLASAGKSVAVLFVAYSLTPSQNYPTPIREGLEALNYVLEEKHRSPSEIIIAGDSAGGAIALAVVSHLSHPSPDLPRVKLNGKLKAAVVMAPWISFRFDWQSYKDNELKDFISSTRVKEWVALYRGDKPTNYYMEAAEAPASWWEDPLVEQLLCTAGGDEILLDSISQWAGRYKVRPITFVYENFTGD
jgi:acetyl esterase/lipase